MKRCLLFHEALIDPQYINIKSRIVTISSNIEKDILRSAVKQSTQLLFEF